VTLPAEPDEFEGVAQHFEIVRLKYLRLNSIEIVPHLDTLNRAALEADHVVVVTRFVEYFVALHALKEIDFANDPLFEEKVDLAVDGGFIDLEGPALERGDNLSRGEGAFMAAKELHDGAPDLRHPVTSLLELFEDSRCVAHVVSLAGQRSKVPTFVGTFSQLRERSTVFLSRVPLLAAL